ncbi:MAG: hypothetical protein IPK58_15530 [Acidobacteria bacterium]|nr:hypothetical protein [Acidobacteriota bacterium]
MVRVVEAENAAFLDRYGYLGYVNMEFFYPIMQGRKAAGADRQAADRKPATGIDQRKPEPEPARNRSTQTKFLRSPTRPSSTRRTVRFR